LETLNLGTVIKLVSVAVEAVAPCDLPNLRARQQIFEFLMKIRFIVGHGEHANAYL
jgi:hypothetical protein